MDKSKSRSVPLQGPYFCANFAIINSSVPKKKVAGGIDEYGTPYMIVDESKMTFQKAIDHFPPNTTFTVNDSFSLHRDMRFPTVPSERSHYFRGKRRSTVSAKFLFGPV